MKRLKTLLVVATGIAVVSLAVSLTPVGHVVAQQMKPLLVQVINTSAEPVPVTGNISASGTVNAVQSGTWNVGITGRPSVELVPANPLSPRGTAQTNGDTGVRAQLFDVPSGQLMIVEFVSVFVSVEAGLTLWDPHDFHSDGQ